MSSADKHRELAERPIMGVADKHLALARKLVQHSRKERGLGRIDEDIAALLQFDIAYLVGQIERDVRAEALQSLIHKLNTEFSCYPACMNGDCLRCRMAAALAAPEAPQAMEDDK